MSIHYAGVALLGLSAAGAGAQSAAPAAIEHFTSAHQASCVAALSARVNSAGYELPFGYVDNFCACMGKALFGPMTAAEQAHFEDPATEALPRSMALREARSRERCAMTTSELYAADN
jgi:hypothetical protein